MYCDLSKTAASGDVQVRNRKTEYVSKWNKISAQKAHELFGHGNKDGDRQIAKHLGYEIVGEPLKPCGSCREDKAKREPLAKVSKREPSSYPNELVFSDLSTIKKSQSYYEVKKINKPV